MRKFIWIAVSVLLLSSPSAAKQTPVDLLAPTPTAGPAAAPVTLADAGSFDAPTPEMTLDEISEARKEMASAVSASKFVNGFSAVLTAAILLLAIAP